MRFGFGIEAYMRIETGKIAQPLGALALPAPEIVPLETAGSFNLTVPIRVGWQVLSEELSRQLEGEHFSSGPLSLTAKGLALAGRDDRVLARVDYLLGSTPGTAYATSRLVYDQAGHSLWFTDLQFTDGLGTPRSDPGDAMLHGLLRSVIGKPRLSLEKYIERARAAANEALTKLSGRLQKHGLSPTVTVSSIDILHLSPETSSLNITASVTGSALLTIKDFSLQ